METAISLDHIYKTINNREILKGISFTVNPGDIFGYLGPNGAGKTTTIRILLGVFYPDKGKALIHNRAAHDSDVRKRIGFLLDNDGLYDNLTATENLAYYCELYGMPRQGRKERIGEMLRMAGLADRAGEKISGFSRGMRQKLALARALIHDPELLILDEPTAGIDPSGQIEMRDLIRSLADKERKTIFLSSHNLDEVQRICNRIALIDNGVIKLYGELESLRGNEGKNNLQITIRHENGLTGESRLNEIAVELKGLSVVCDAGVDDGRLNVMMQEDCDISEIVLFLSRKGIKIEEITRLQTSVEELYADAVRRDQDE